MALSSTRIRDRAIELQDQKIAALGASPSLADVRNAIEEGRAEAVVEELNNYLSVSVSNVQVDPQTGTQIGEAAGNVAT
jgi:hypothetical protein